MSSMVEENIKSLKDGIAEALKQIRQEEGLSQQDLAEILNVDQSLISRIERSTNDRIDLVILCKIFDVMNMDIEINFLERD